MVASSSMDFNSMCMQYKANIDTDPVPAWSEDHYADQDRGGGLQYDGFDGPHPCKFHPI